MALCAEKGAQTTKKASKDLRCFLRFLLAQIETLLKAINTSAGIYQLLLTREERMTLRTYVNDDILLGRTGLDDVAACTANGRLLVIRMDSLLHVVSPLSR